MLYSETDPESYITEYTLVYEENCKDQNQNSRRLFLQKPDHWGIPKLNTRPGEIERALSRVLRPLSTCTEALKGLFRTSKP